MNRFVAMGIAAGLLGLAATAFAGAKLGMKSESDKGRVHGRNTSPGGRPVERGPGVLSAKQEDADVEDLHQLEASLKELHSFNTEGKSSLNAMPSSCSRQRARTRVIRYASVSDGCRAARSVNSS